MPLVSLCLCLSVPLSLCLYVSLSVWLSVSSRLLSLVSLYSSTPLLSSDQARSKTHAPRRRSSPPLPPPATARPHTPTPRPPPSGHRYLWEGAYGSGHTEYGKPNVTAATCGARSATTPPVAVRALWARGLSADDDGDGDGDGACEDVDAFLLEVSLPVHESS